MAEGWRRVALIGFMGTGKTTVGALLAAELGLVFIDLDMALAARAGRSIPEIFALEGEAGFRRRESQVLAEVCGRPAQVMATGGGVILDPGNVSILRSTCLVVALTAGLATILARVHGDGERPLLAGPNPAEVVAALLAKRERLYRDAAHLVIDTTEQEPSLIAGKIAEWCRAQWREGTRRD